MFENKDVSERWYVLLFSREERTGTMRNYKLVISYDGSRYKGWQRQPLLDLTIQSVLENRVGELLGYPVEVSGSGRTDAGVHARRQIATMKVAGILDDNFMDTLNLVLPEDIRVLQTELVPNRFHARYSAKGKKYCYYIDTGERPSVFERKFVYHYPQIPDVKEMKRAAQLLKGIHDFTAFTDDRQEKSKVREIYDIQIMQKGSRLKMEYYGSGFLYHMVRILTGTLLEIGVGEKKAEDIPKIIEQKQRANAGFLVPAKGLFLEEVYYEIHDKERLEDVE